MSKKVALKLMFLILGMTFIFHFLIFMEVIPYDLVWAGRLNSVEDMKTFETFSMLINAFMIMVLAIKYSLLQREKRDKVIHALIWAFVVLFALNTIGNLFAQNKIELIFGTLLTLVSGILCLVIVKKEKTDKNVPHE